MGSLNGRIGRLEGRIPPPEDKGAELRRAVRTDILDEIARLKSLRGHGIHRTGGPNIPPFDPVGRPSAIRTRTEDLSSLPCAVCSSVSGRRRPKS
jgi:hypothetical protein